MYVVFAVIAIGAIKTWLAHGHPVPVVAPPPVAGATAAVGAWIVLRAFASGCTAMTGVEAVSNGVTAFREPAVATVVLLLASHEPGVLNAGTEDETRKSPPMVRVSYD